MSLRFWHIPSVTVLACVLALTGASVLRAHGADAPPGSTPSLEDVAHAPTTLTIDGKELTLLLTCRQRTTGFSGQNPGPQSRRPPPVTTRSATLQITGSATQDPPTVTAVGVWCSDGSFNGQPTLFTSSLTIRTVSQIEPIDQTGYMKQSFVVAVDDAAGQRHLVKVDGWMERPAPMPP